MNTDRAVARLAEVIRRKHLALNTEQSYCAWLRRYCQHFPRTCRPNKNSSSLTALAKTNIAASTQNQAFNAIIFFYKEVLGTELKTFRPCAPGGRPNCATLPARMRFCSCS